ncbi:MAG: ornithine cyclodeaminase family protein [Synergistes sp.]|nr:ornithine cyclodeaminase family protein [Synergistes sp.]
MLYLSADEIRKFFNMRDAIESDREALILQRQGMAEVPVRTNFNVQGKGISSVMPAYIKKYPQVGIKIVSTFPHNFTKGKPSVTATTLLLDSEDGTVCAILDGTLMTQMRTGAVSGLATELLARKDAKIAALFGTGGQAQAQLEALLTVRPIKEVRVYDSFRENKENFITRMTPLAEKFGAKLRAAATPNEAIDDADVITTVTTSSEPVFDGRGVKEGAHINAVGVFTPEKHELDEYIVNRADKIFLDNREAVLEEAGDFLIPLRKGNFSLNKITGEIGDLLLGYAKGRESDREITLMKTVGFATLDVTIAHKTYEKAVASGAGVDVTTDYMHHPRHSQATPVAPTYGYTPPPQSGPDCLAAGTSNQRKPLSRLSVKKEFISVSIGDKNAENADKYF